MKSFYRIVTAVTAVILFVFAWANWYMVRDVKEGRSYRVEIERAVQNIEKDGFQKAEFGKYPSILQVEELKEGEEKRFLEGGEADYLIREAGGKYYRFDYQAEDEKSRKRMLYTLNLGLLVMSLVVYLVMFFLRTRLLKPFGQLQELPFELSRGNLTMPAQENKNQFFGRFVWGMDLLRENLEQQKQDRFKLEKEKRTLVLSISHDIKTPLSAIKLYAKALSTGLYGDVQKQKETAEKINEKADEIEGFVSQMIRASREDFLYLEVREGEFYLSQVMGKISGYYKDKLELLKINFYVEHCQDCLLKGDGDRAVEVLQNLLENAVKYGDGREIGISFSEEEDCRLVMVSNSGCTLGEEELPHIFDSFWRGQNAGNTGGNGLGLYICRQLMNRMGGEIFALREGDRMKVTAVFQKV